MAFSGIRNTNFIYKRFVMYKVLKEQQEKKHVFAFDCGCQKTTD